MHRCPRCNSFCYCDDTPEEYSSPPDCLHSCEDEFPDGMGYVACDRCGYWVMEDEISIRTDRWGSAVFLCTSCLEELKGSPYLSDEEE